MLHIVPFGYFCRYYNQIYKMSAINLASLSKEDILRFVSSFDTVLCDCDGVLWLDNIALPGSSATLDRFRKLGKRVFYVTNNSTKTREEFVSKFHHLGFQATSDEVMSTSYLAACYLTDLNFKKKVYIVGSSGVTQELDMVGIKHTGIGPDTLCTTLANLVNHDFVRDPDIGAVLVGFDEHFSYPKMLKAASYLNQPSCIFIATNTDERFPMATDLVVPGTGSIVAAIESCAGREAFKIGKPSAYIRDAIMKRHNVEPSRTLMIGDRGNTDILLGSRCGFQTLLVLTGVSTLDEVEEWKVSNKDVQGCVPDYYIESLGHLQKLI